MSALSQAVSRGIKNIWSHGDEDDYEADETASGQNAGTAPSYANPASQRTDSFVPKPSYTPSYGGGSGGLSRRLRPVADPLRRREKNIYTLKPKSQDEACIAADYLKTGSAVVLNLEEVDRVMATRIIDFMSGVCYGLDGQGHAMKLGDSIFLFTPAEFEISSDELDYGENRDFFFKDVEESVAPSLQSPARPGAAANPSSAAPGGGSVLLPPAQSSSPGNISPSGYATADYSGPHSPSSTSSTPPVSGMNMSAPASGLPTSSVYGSSGKAHVLIGGQPANVNPGVSPSPQSSYQSSERRSWER